MPRKPSPEAPAAKATTRDTEIEAAHDAADQRSVMLAEIQQKFGDGVEYDRNRVMTEAQFFFKQGNEAAFALGKRLILLKEHEGHGFFIKALDTIEMDRMAAWRLMTNTAKFSNVTPMLHLPQTKLLALSFMDDAEIDALAKGGTVAGLELDEIECMSVRELKAALRKEKEEREADQEILAQKQAKIDKLERSKLKKQPFDEDLELGTTALKKQADICEKSLRAMFEVLEKISGVLPNVPEDQAATVSEQVLLQVNRALGKVEDIKAEFDGNIAPYVPSRGE